ATVSGGLINMAASLPGREMNRNQEMLDGTTGYAVYDNSGGGHTTISSVSPLSFPPNSSGKVLRVSYDGAGTPGTNPTPGFGGFYVSIGECGNSGTNYAVNGYCYREGERVVYDIWANIPSGRTLAFATNSYGSGGTFNWETSQAGTGNWQEYVGIQQIGISGTKSTTGFFYITNSGGNTAFNWDVASVELKAIDEPAGVAFSPGLNVGYYQGANLNYGQLLTTNDAFLAASSGNVGIGTTSPGSELQVNGNTAIGYSSSTAGPANGLAVSGNVGIGTNTASNGELDIEGNSSQPVWISSNTSTSHLVIDNNGGSNNQVLYFRTTGSGNGVIQFSKDFQLKTSGGTNLVYLTNSGNVGIGTTTPGSIL